jgi:hypothetical protein
VRQVSAGFRTTLLFMTVGLATHPALAQPMTPEAIEQHEREIIRAWDVHDSVKILEPIGNIRAVGFA